MSIKKTTNLKWLIPVILIGSTAVVIGQGIQWSRPPVAESSQQMELPPRPVTTGKLTTGEATQTIQLVGQVKATGQATIRSQVDGEVKQVLVEVGDRLTPDQTIAILDDSNQKLAVLAAEARLAEEKSKLESLEVGTRTETIAQRQAELNGAKAREREAQDNLERLTTLSQEGAISERDLVLGKTQADAASNERIRIEASLTEAESGPTPEEIAAQRAILQGAEVSLQQAQLDLERTTITTDFPGVVETRQVSPGDYIESSDSIITLINPEEIYIFLEIPEQLIGQVKIGQTVQLQARALPNWQQQGIIDAILPGTDAVTRRQVVRVNLPEYNPSLLPEMSIQGTIELPVSTTEEVFIVPRDALTNRGENWVIFVVENELVQEYQVTILADQGEEVAIANPQLQSGQEIVIAGGEGLNQGAKVKITNKKS